MEINIGSWDRFADKFTDVALEVGIRLVAAVVIYIIGRFLIRKLVKAVGKLKSFKSLDMTAAGYITTSIKTVLYIGLVLSIIALLGVPMSSIIAIVASVGVAIGMALQGALGNIAGGIMLLIFRPFSAGDYIVTSAGEEGTVRSISLVYTVLTTVDNRRISIPNGNLMNSSISNATAETLRRVDLTFDIAGNENVKKVEATIMKAVVASEKALAKPEPQVLPFETITDGLSYVVRVWVDTKDYWDVYNELMTSIPTALSEAEIKRPAMPVRVSNM